VTKQCGRKNGSEVKISDDDLSLQSEKGLTFIFGGLAMNISPPPRDPAYRFLLR
jgi:hypothetical protein